MNVYIYILDKLFSNLKNVFGTFLILKKGQS